MGTRLLPRSRLYSSLSEDADNVGGQLRGDKECPFSGVTKSGRVWRKVLESNAGRVGTNTKHARKHEARPLRVKEEEEEEEGPSRSKQFWFYLCWQKQRGWL